MNSTVSPGPTHKSVFNTIRTQFSLLTFGRFLFMPVGAGTDSVVREGSQRLASIAKRHFGDRTLALSGMEGKGAQKVVVNFSFNLL